MQTRLSVQTHWTGGVVPPFIVARDSLRTCCVPAVRVELKRMNDVTLLEPTSNLSWKLSVMTTGRFNVTIDRCAVKAMFCCDILSIFHKLLHQYLKKTRSCIHVLQIQRDWHNELFTRCLRLICDNHVWI